MGQIPLHAAEYETVRRFSAMLESAKEDYKATESYALFAAIICWVIQRARTPANSNAPDDIQAREVGIALQGSRISGKPWLVLEVPEMTAFDFFTCIRNAVAHGDGRQIRPLNENDVLKGQIIRLAGRDLELRRTDMRRLGCALAELFCRTMVAHQQEGNLEEEARRIEKSEAAE